MGILRAHQSVGAGRYTSRWLLVGRGWDGDARLVVSGQKESRGYGLGGVGR